MGFLLCALVLLLWPVSADPAFAQQPQRSKIRVLVCGDDFGVAHTFLDAATQAYREGILRCVNVIVPGQWFPGAVRRLNENPGIGVGLHLALTSEWDGLRYRSMTLARTLADANAYLFQTGPGMLNNRSESGKLGPDMAEVEREFRAQIETIKRRIPRVAWIWPHLPVATSMPELSALTERLAREYDLPLLPKGSLVIKHLAGPGLGTKADSQAKAQTIVKVLNDLQPGTYFLITHPSLDESEVRSLRVTENIG